MRYRYPGIQPFSQSEQALFFGRAKEIKELYRLVVLNPVVVLFGKSGIGKTSLLQAGVDPLLQERFLHPVKIRLNNREQGISKQIFEQLNEAKVLPVNTHQDLSLWEYCQQFIYVSSGETHTPVLILDQFEELFTLYQDQPEAQQDFIIQLDEVVNQNPPERLFKPEWSPQEKANFVKPPKVHIVISIRSDYLYLLDRLTYRIPSILRCRYELNALDEQNAKVAITQPAGLVPDALSESDDETSIVPFISPPFQYHPSALDDIIRNLTQIDEVKALPGKNIAQAEIEAFQLQLLCRKIEDKIIRENQPAHFEVTPAFYDGKTGIEAILHDFYNNVLSKFTKQKRLNIQKLVEEKLLSGEQRILQEKGHLEKDCQVTDEDLTLLTHERLIKEEPRGGSFYYEISHDTLIKPIVKERDLRIKRETQERLEKERIETEQRVREFEEKAQHEEALKNQAIKGQRRAQVLFFIALAIALFSIFQSIKLRKQTNTIGRMSDTLRTKYDELDSTNAIVQKSLDSLNLLVRLRDSIEAERIWDQAEDLNRRAEDLQEDFPQRAANKRKERENLLDQYKNNRFLRIKRNNPNQNK